MADSTPNQDCGDDGSCNCLALFDATFTSYVLMMLFFIFSRVALGCSTNNPGTNRRQLKTNVRKIDLAFGFVFQFFTALMLYGFFKDYARDECHANKRYQRMNQVAQVVMFLASISDIFMLIMAVSVAVRMYRAKRRSMQDPPLLSSDEEDDAEFIRELENRNQNRSEEPDSDEDVVPIDLPQQDPRNMLVGRIREII